jgi:hypothetical protein
MSHAGERGDCLKNNSKNSVAPVYFNSPSNIEPSALRASSKVGSNALSKSSATTEKHSIDGASLLSSLKVEDMCGFAQKTQRTELVGTASESLALLFEVN